MNNQVLSVYVRLDAKSFRAFALFDTLKRQKRWISPAIFSLILLACSAISFAMQKTSGSLLLGIVLLLVALGLPAVYFYTFLSSIKKQIRQLNLQKPVHVYTVELAEPDRGVFFHPGNTQNSRNAASPKNAASSRGSHSAPGPRTSQEITAPAECFAWDTLFAAYRTKTAVYLYLTPQRAVLMPENLCGHPLDEIWTLLANRLPAEKLHG